MVVTGEGNEPEAIVPLARRRARDRAEVMQRAGLNSSNITVNLNMPNVTSPDPITLRSQIIPALNRQVRRGEKLIASKLR